MRILKAIGLLLVQLFVSIGSVVSLLFITAYCWFGDRIFPLEYVYLKYYGFGLAIVLVAVFALSLLGIIGIKDTYEE